MDRKELDLGPFNRNIRFLQDGEEANYPTSKWGHKAYWYSGADGHTILNSDYLIGDFIIPMLTLSMFLEHNIPKKDVTKKINESIKLLEAVIVNRILKLANTSCGPLRVSRVVIPIKNKLTFKKERYSWCGRMNFGICAFIR